MKRKVARAIFCKTSTAVSQVIGEILFEKGLVILAITSKHLLVKVKICPKLTIKNFEDFLFLNSFSRGSIVDFKQVKMLALYNSLYRNS